MKKLTKLKLAKSKLRTAIVMVCTLALAIPMMLTPTLQAKAADTTVPIYRLYNPDNGEHLYTTDANETRVLYYEHNWGYEGIAWYAPNGTGTPVYRLYNPVLCNHLYTTDTNEVAVLTSTAGWVSDNNGQPVFYSDGTIPVYRVYNRELQGMHHLTTDKNEYDTLPIHGWTQEGVSLYARTIGSPIITRYWNESGEELSLETASNESTTGGGSGNSSGSTNGGSSESNGSSGGSGSSGHVHSYTWETSGKTRTAKCSCGVTGVTEEYVAGVWGYFDRGAAESLYNYVNGQRAATTYEVQDYDGHTIGIETVPALTNFDGLYATAKQRAAEVVTNYNHSGMKTDNENLGNGWENAQACYEGWCYSVDHARTLSNQIYTQGSCAVFYYDADGSGQNLYPVYVLVVNK